MIKVVVIWRYLIELYLLLRKMLYLSSSWPTVSLRNKMNESRLLNSFVIITALEKFELMFK